MITTLRCAVLAALIASPAFADDFGVPIDLGKKASIELTFVKGGTVSQGSNKQTVAPMTFRYRQDIVAIKGGYHITQTLTGFDGAPDDQVAQAAQASALIVYDTDEGLVPLRITNWSQVADAFGTTMAKLENLDAAAVEKAVATLKAMSPEAAAQTMLKEQVVLSATQMAGFDLHKPIRDKVQAANPLGGPPIDQVVTAELISIDKAAGVAVIDYDARFDPDSMKASLMQLFQRMSGKAPSPAELAGFKIENNLACRYTMSLKTGLANEAVCHVHTVVSTSAETQSSRDETWRLTQRLVKP